jgi:NAD(P)H-dependent FMN reductase/GNAT superfamily N-acetyltransferase
MVLVASSRPGRLGPAVARWFLTASQGEELAGSVDLADLGEIGLPMLDEPEHPSSGVYQHEHTRRWSVRVAAADAFVVVTPEYNYGMPAVLKNALDYLYAEWAWKPVAFVSYGNTSAGTRSVQMTKQVVTTLRMMPIGATVALHIADTIEDGQVRDDAVPADAARAVLSELLRVAAALRPLRSPVAAVAHASGASLTPAVADDAAELLVLQRCCWVQEALANDTLDIPALRETLDDVREWSASWQVWTARRHGRLVGAVRARAAGDTWAIGRLMVAPDLAGQGIGRWLLAHAESQAPPRTVGYTLVTGARSARNIGLYQRAGYRRTEGPGEGGIVHLRKDRPRPVPPLTASDEATSTAVHRAPGRRCPPAGARAVGISATSEA